MMKNNIRKLQDHIKSLDTVEVSSGSDLEPAIDLQKSLDEGDFEDEGGYTRIGNFFIIHWNVDYDPENAFMHQKLREMRIRHKNQDV